MRLGEIWAQNDELSELWLYVMFGWWWWNCVMLYVNVIERVGWKLSIRVEKLILKKWNLCAMAWFTNQFLIWMNFFCCFIAYQISWNDILFISHLSEHDRVRKRHFACCSTSWMGMKWIDGYVTGWEWKKFSRFLGCELDLIVPRKWAYFPSFLSVVEISTICCELIKSWKDITSYESCVRIHFRYFSTKKCAVIVSLALQPPVFTSKSRPLKITKVWRGEKWQKKIGKLFLGDNDAPSPTVILHLLKHESWKLCWIWTNFMFKFFLAKVYSTSRQNHRIFFNLFKIELN